MPVPAVAHRTRSRSSVASALRSQAAKDEAGLPYAAPATVYVCYDKGATVFDLLEIVDRYAMAQPKVEEVYVWIDLLCTNHHEAPEDPLPMLWWQTTFKAGLKAIGTTCLALHPWDDAPALRDLWCACAYVCLHAPSAHPCAARSFACPTAAHACALGARADAHARARAPQVPLPATHSHRAGRAAADAPRHAGWAQRRRRRRRK